MKSLGSLLSIGWVRISLAFILLCGVGWYISDSVGVGFGWLGALFWVVIATFTATFGIIYFAQFLTPIAGDDGWWKGLFLIFRAFSAPAPQNSRTIIEEKPKKGQRGQRRKTVVTPVHRNPDEPPPSFKTLRAGILRTFQVFALVQGGKFAGSRGPGFVTLNENENVRHVIDLRVQKRDEKKVRVTTRDGIQIVTSVSVTFRIKQSSRLHNKHTLYPYDQNAIFQISYADAIDDHGDTLPWQDKIVPQAITLISQEVSKFALNELTRLEGGVSHVDEINRIVSKEMVDKFALRGIEIISAGMSTPVLPSSIQTQFIAAWRAEWQEKINEKVAEGEAQALRRQKQARARAQIEMIDAISRNLNTMKREDDSEMVEILTLRMIEALEQAITSGKVKAEVPQQIMANLIADTSRYMRSAAEDSSDIAFDVPQPPQFNFLHQTEEDRDSDEANDEEGYEAA